MQQHAWIESIPVSITVCDKDGKILAMNEASDKVYKKYGGKSLIGSSLLDCHPEPSRTQVQDMLSNHENNIYTIESGGEKKMIYQTSWYLEGEYAGIVEIILSIPEETPHIVRD